MARPKGSPNKVPAGAKEKLAKLIEGKADKLAAWIEQTAEGIRGEDGEWAVRPNPGLATSLVGQLAEYCIPKLARTEVAGADGLAIQIQIGKEFSSKEK